MEKEKPNEEWTDEDIELYHRTGDVPLAKGVEEKTKLFPSKTVKGMLTDGQGAYYLDDKEKTLSEKITMSAGRTHRYFREKDVKEAVEKERELCTLFAKGKISWMDFLIKRDSIFGRFE